MSKRKVMDILQAAAAELGTEIKQDGNRRFLIRYEYVDYYIVTFRYKFWIGQEVIGYNGNLTEEEFHTMLGVVKGYHPECYGFWNEVVSFVHTPSYHCITNGKAISGKALGEILSKFFEAWSFACINAFLLTDETIWGEGVMDETDNRDSDVAFKEPMEPTGNDIDISPGRSVLPMPTHHSMDIVALAKFGKDEDDVEIHFKDTVNADGSVTPGRVEHISKEKFAATYKCTVADNEEFVQSGNASGTNEETYAVICRSLPHPRDGVNIMNNSGLENKTCGFAEADRECFNWKYMGSKTCAAKIEKLLAEISDNIKLKQ